MRRRRKLEVSGLTLVAPITNLHWSASWSAEWGDVRIARALEVLLEAWVETKLRTGIVGTHGRASHIRRSWSQQVVEARRFIDDVERLCVVRGVLRTVGAKVDAGRVLVCDVVLLGFGVLHIHIHDARQLTRLWGGVAIVGVGGLVGGGHSRCESVYVRVRCSSSFVVVLQVAAKLRRPRIPPSRPQALTLPK